MAVNNDKARAFGRSLSDFGELNHAEKEVVAAAREGRIARLGPGIPETEDEKSRRTIRAALVRFLALGGDDTTPVHEQGVQIAGAMIAGALDLDGCTLCGNLILMNSELSEGLILRDARTRSVNLQGSRSGAISADGVEVAGDLFFRRAFKAKGVVRLLGARITGDISCRGGHFEGADESGNALHCDRIEIGGTLSMSDGFTALGAVRLLGAAIKGNVNCIGGRFEGKDEGGRALHCDRIEVGGNVFLIDGFKSSNTVRLVSARIRGDLGCQGGTFSANPPESALCMDLARATVQGTVWLGTTQTSSHFAGGIDLTGARIGRLVDAVAAGARRGGNVNTPFSDGAIPHFQLLDGCCYERFAESTDLSAQARIAFLRLQPDDDLGRNFKPQPWTQMIKALREAGHTSEARDVAIQFELQRQKAGLLRSKHILTRLGWYLYSIYGGLVGYGHRPMRLVVITLGLWLGCGILYHIAALQGVFGPSNPLVFQNPAYEHCRPEYKQYAPELPERVGNWYWCPAVPGEFTTFNPYLYSLDLILPLVDLQQDRDWAPIVPTPKATWFDLFSPSTFEFSHFVRWVVWIEILFGWLASLLFASVAAGFIKRMESE